MKPICVALTNMSGIACASDRDHTIYQLSKRVPFAIAVNPDSPIPWYSITEQYKLSDEPEESEEFSDYATHFIAFLSNHFAEKSWSDIPADDTNVFFMGYGKEDLFPSVYDTVLRINSGNGQFEATQVVYNKISHQECTAVNLLCNIDSVSTLLFGVTNDVKVDAFDKLVQQYEIYKERVNEHFKDTKYADFVHKKLGTFDVEEVAANLVNSASDNIRADVSMGINSFSIEDLVTAAETLVDAEVRFKHLLSKGKEYSHATKEIAVITHTEGVTWLKHSVFAL